MAVDRSFVERNRESRGRMRALAALGDAELRTPVGEHWTAAIVLAHLAWWDRLALHVLDMTQQNGKLVVPNIETTVNDVSLPLWAAIPPREAGRIAIEAAEAVDRRLETYPPELLQEIYTYRNRWVERYLHRSEHLAEAEAALHR